MEGLYAPLPNAGQRVPIKSGRRIGIEQFCIYAIVAKSSVISNCHVSIVPVLASCAATLQLQEKSMSCARAVLLFPIFSTGLVSLKELLLLSPQVTASRWIQIMAAPGLLYHMINDAATASREGKGMFIHDGYSAPYINDIPFSRVLEIGFISSYVNGRN